MVGPKRSGKDRWIAIRKGNKSPRMRNGKMPDRFGPTIGNTFRYERPKPNLNKGAGLVFQPAVRDYLGLSETDVTDWQFVDFKHVPHGPWSKLGENNTFITADRKRRDTVGSAKSSGGPELRPLRTSCISFARPDKIGVMRTLQAIILTFCCT